MEPMENSMKTHVLRRNLLKTNKNSGSALETMENKRKHRCCVGTNCESKENTYVLRRNLWKTFGKHRSCVGTYSKHNENAGVAWEPIEN